MSNFYISTAIAYINSNPHLGYALELIMSDAIARYKKQQNDDVFFSTWTDEHWLKVYNTAKKHKITSQELCDKNAEAFKNLTSTLNIDNSDFIRTTDKEKHWPSVHKIWWELEDDIYKKEYEGLYCEWCETFLAKKDLIDGKCAIHKTKPNKVNESNYFFKLSKYSDDILRKIKSKELKIIPEFREKEFVAMLEDTGLIDVSFSRSVTSVPWGIPVPDDKSQNMYVWSDALTNYISVLDYANNWDKFQKYWKNWRRVHVIWKDIVRFHAGIWVGMLMSAKIELPDEIIIHGFLTSEWEKMSKSTWNVIDPFITIENYWVDALRYFLLSQVPVGQDYDFTKSQFENIYTAHLWNNLGNLINRVVVLSEKNWVKPEMRWNEIKKFWYLENLFKSEISNTWKDIENFMNEYELHKVMERILQSLQFANKQMDETKPWGLVKENIEDFNEIMTLFIEFMRQISYILEPFIPNASEKMLNILGCPKTSKLEEKKEWNSQKKWTTFGEKEILFPRLEK